MPNPTFRALVLDQQDGNVQAAMRDLRTSDLPEGDVLVSVAYSSLNYKDGLAVTNKGRIVRNFPMIPGIDLAGTVEESSSPSYQPGDSVILTGWGIGERHWGGFAQQARVKADWLVPRPDGLGLQQAMGIGTAGFTAMLCVMTLEERGVQPGGREVLVTGAGGGVGGPERAASNSLLACFHGGCSESAGSPPRREHEIAAMLDERVGLARKPARLARFLSDCHTWPECMRGARPELPNLER